MYDEYAEEALEYDREFASLDKISKQLDAGLERLEGIRDAIMKHGISKPMMEAADPTGELVTSGMVASYEDLALIPMRDEHADSALEGIGEGIKKFFQAIWDFFKSIGAFIARWVSFVFRGFKHKEETLKTLNDNVITNAHVTVIRVKPPTPSPAVAAKVEQKAVEVKRVEIEVKTLYHADHRNLMATLMDVVVLRNALARSVIEFVKVGTPASHEKVSLLISDINFKLKHALTLDFTPHSENDRIGKIELPKLKRQTAIAAGYKLSDFSPLILDSIKANSSVVRDMGVDLGHIDDAISAHTNLLKREITAADKAGDQKLLVDIKVTENALRRAYISVKDVYRFTTSVSDLIFSSVFNLTTGSKSW